jgi:hypothetical protein
MSYTSAHAKLRAARGPASDYPCIDCGAVARHWSYSYESAQQHQDTENGSLYSYDPNDYEPRCVRCHAYFDETAAFYNGSPVPLFARKQIKKDGATERNLKGPTTFKKVVTDKNALKRVFTN